MKYKVTANGQLAEMRSVEANQEVVYVRFKLREGDAFSKGDEVTIAESFDGKGLVLYNGIIREKRGRSYKLLVDQKEKSNVTT
jgi:hypothetical protein